MISTYLHEAFSADELHECISKAVSSHEEELGNICEKVSESQRLAPPFFVPCLRCLD